MAFRDESVPSTCSSHFSAFSCTRSRSSTLSAHTALSGEPNHIPIQIPPILAFVAKVRFAKCRYVDDLKRYFRSSLALLLTRGFNPSWCGSRCTLTKMLSFPITVFCISFLLNFSNTFAFLSFKSASPHLYMSGSYNIYFSRA